MTPTVLVCTIICMIVAFLLCGIPCGQLVAKRLAGVDVRTVGSGNIGMTNVARAAGGRAAAITFGLDVGKGAVAMALGRLVLSLVARVPWSETSAMGQLGLSASLLFAACVFGHMFSPYLGLRGGKGISVGFGAVLLLWWPVGLAILAVFLLFALPSRYVSLGSIAAAVALVICSLAMGLGVARSLPVVAVCLVVILKHRGNIARLRKGTESAFVIHHTDRDR